MWRYEWFCVWDHNKEDPGYLPQHSHSVQGRDFAGYPCKTFHHNDTHQGFWFSGPQDKNTITKPIIFRGEIEKIQRITVIVIDWYLVPDDWEFQTSVDMNSWEPAFNNK
jgi:hypothetical protein